MFHFSSLSLSLVPKVCTQVNLCSPSLSLSLSLSVRPVPCYLPVGVISTVISAFLLFARITETASIAEKMFSHPHGYAFSQEEHGVIAQAELIRVYDTTKSKPEGL
ncbi:unnamed protein product [Acanthosepion pharaonis]|uniref:Uncharacterized protein n=1 Tax=Acanthosepion pharaonis TaxID=158019 RepID=A0A812DTB7_ACAPH|nr:unnamed protein product [Sepia pharaonis]